MLLTDTDSPENVETISCAQGVEWNIMEMLQVVSGTKSHKPWKFHENPFTRFSVMLLTGNEKAIGDCVLSKISKMMITRKIMMTTVVIEKILKSVQHLESQSNSPHFELLLDVLA